MLTQHIIDMQGNIFCEQQSIVTRRVKQAIPEGDARKSEFLEVPYSAPHKLLHITQLNLPRLKFSYVD